MGHFSLNRGRELSGPNLDIYGSPVWLSSSYMDTKDAIDTNNWINKSIVKVAPLRFTVAMPTSGKKGVILPRDYV
jgi:hypothetical protein